MSSTRFLTIAEQVAEHLREELQRGRWTDVLPGKHQIAEELGLNNKTIEAALRQLEQEGLLVPQGPGRRRKINVSAISGVRPMRVGILVGDTNDRRMAYMVELHHQLVDAGHTAFFPQRSMAELGMSTRRIARLVTQSQADAWIVVGGPREVLEWFLASDLPVFALFGRRRQLPLAGAGPDKPPIYAEATRRLIKLGHRRIVLLARRARRQPEPGASEQAFLDALESGTGPASSFNLPDWEESREGFQACLHSIFRHTPPTALIIDEVPFFIAAMQFCANRGIRIPQEVSLICTDADPVLDLLAPSVAHISWNPTLVVRRIVRWANNVARGKADHRQGSTKAEFVEGGTIGPAPG